MQYTRSVLVCVLGSGSAGNAIWVESGGTRVLLDAGLSLRETARRCARHGLRLRELSALLLTHEHADHCYGAGVLSRKLGAPVHATAGTFCGLRDAPEDGLRRIVRAGEPVSVGALSITPFAVPHDAREPVGYVVDDGRTRAAVVTDLGAVTEGVVRALQGLDALVLEFNHDVRMLLEGPYPWSLKKRIRGGLGHLSNVEAGRLLRRVLHPGLRHLVLAHLSEQNNTEALATREAEAVLDGSGVRLSVASQARALSPIELSARRERPKQLALFA